MRNGPPAVETAVKPPKKTQCRLRVREATQNPNATRHSQLTKTHNPGRAHSKGARALGATRKLTRGRNPTGPSAGGRSQRESEGGSGVQATDLSPATRQPRTPGGRRPAGPSAGEARKRRRPRPAHGGAGGRSVSTAVGGATAGGVTGAGRARAATGGAGPKSSRKAGEGKGGVAARPKGGTPPRPRRRSPYARAIAQPELGSMSRQSKPCSWMA